MKYSLLLLCMLSILISPSVSAMTVPSVSAETPSVPVHSGGSGEVPAPAIAVRVIIITVFAGISVAGVVKLTDDDKDNDGIGYLMIAPLIGQGIFYLVLEDKSDVTETSGTPETKQ